MLETLQAGNLQSEFPNVFRAFQIFASDNLTGRADIFPFRQNKKWSAESRVLNMSQLIGTWGRTRQTARYRRGSGWFCEEEGKKGTRRENLDGDHYIYNSTYCTISTCLPAARYLTSTQGYFETSHFSLEQVPRWIQTATLDKQLPSDFSSSQFFFKSRG